MDQWTKKKIDKESFHCCFIFQYSIFGVIQRYPAVSGHCVVTGSPPPKKNLYTPHIPSLCSMMLFVWQIIGCVVGIFMCVLKLIAQTPEHIHHHCNASQSGHVLYWQPSRAFALQSDIGCTAVCTDRVPQHHTNVYFITTHHHNQPLCAHAELPQEFAAKWWWTWFGICRPMHKMCKQCVSSQTSIVRQRVYFQRGFPSRLSLVRKSLADVSLPVMSDHLVQIGNFVFVQILWVSMTLELPLAVYTVRPEATLMCDCESFVVT